MGKISAEGMAAVEMEQVKRTTRLNALISTPFDINNKDHIAIIKQYTRDFEYSTNQMYLYQAMNNGLMLGSGAWLLGYLLPLPEFANYFISAFLYLGATGYILERFSMTDFSNQLAEMKTLYNWCFKANEKHYNPTLDNTEKLAQIELQSFIKAIAPLCSVDFMMAWSRETAKPEETKSNWTHVFSASYSALSSTFAFFANSKPAQDLTQLRELKIAIETRSLDVGVYKGFEQSLRYFSTNIDFRQMMAEKVGGIKNEALLNYDWISTQNPA